MMTGKTTFTFRGAAPRVAAAQPRAARHAQASVFPLVNKDGLADAARALSAALTAAGLANVVDTTGAPRAALPMFRFGRLSWEKSKSQAGYDLQRTRQARGGPPCPWSSFAVCVENN